MNPSADKVGPSVMSRNDSEAGYLVVLRKEIHAGACGRRDAFEFALAEGGAGWDAIWIAGLGALHGRGSPYRLNPRKSRNNNTAVLPRIRQILRRECASMIMTRPKT